MVTIKIISTTLFVALLAGLVPFSSTFHHGHSQIQMFIYRLQQHLLSDPKALNFTMRAFALQDMEGTTESFQDLCLAYEGEYGNPATALDKAIYYEFYYYKEHGDEDTLEKIEEGDPLGFISYLRRMRVNKEDKGFSRCIDKFYDTMQARFRLHALKYELTDIPDDVLNPIATEYSGLQAKPINYFIKIASQQTKKKMYGIDLVVMDEFATYTNKKVDDIQIFGATYYNFGGPSQINLHALCINYKASTRKVHVYDSGNSGFLEGRQQGIVQKLYPDRDIVFEKATALQQGNTTCAIFAITYATMLINGKDPAKDKFKLNDVHGDETVFMRLHILDMLSQRKVFFPKDWN